ncbi:hypothetical protein JL720_13532 [Aureococcus anophagefferens]|nr:hypothetical protein JL720_13532 [Aureococcus anophagefferens]
MGAVRNFVAPSGMRVRGNITFNIACGKTRAMKRLGVTALAGIARGSWVGPSDCVRDANGCCASAGFFYCGSSGRCTHDWDQCEDGLGDAPSSCALDYEVGGERVLRPGALRIRTGSVDYEANGSSAAKIIFNVCANAATPRACVNTTGADGAASTSPAAAFAVFGDDVDGAHERCARLSGSASRDDTFAASPLDAAGAASRSTTPAATSAGDRRAGGVRLDVLCDEAATSRPRGLRDDARACAFSVALRSVHGARWPARAASGAVCGGHGDCAGRRLGRARCDCDRGFSGPACDGGAARRAPDPRPGPRAWKWQTAIVVAGAVAATVGVRCDARRRRAAPRSRGSDTRCRTVDVTDDDDAGVDGRRARALPVAPRPWPDDDEEVKAAFRR